MPMIAAMIVGPKEQEFVRDQLAGVATVRFCDSVASLDRLAAEDEVEAVLADLRDRSGESVLSTLVAIHGRAPALPLIVCFRPTPVALREVPNVIAAGMGVGVVVRGFEHLGLMLRPLLGPPRAPSAAETLVRHIVPLAPPLLHAFFVIGALKASPHLGVATAARWSGMSARTLERRLRRANMPGASAVLGSYTALHAAWWLDVQGWSAKQVVGEMHFSHPSALTRLLQHHFDCSLTSLSSQGGFPALLFRFETTLLGGSAPPFHY